MEQILASLLCWIDTSSEIVNLNSGVRIEQLSPDDIAEIRADGDDDAPEIPDDVKTVVVVTYANGLAGYYFDEDATAVMDRALKFAAIGEILMSQAAATARDIQTGVGVQP
jgi:hypothetical protein